MNNHNITLDPKTKRFGVKREVTMVRKNNQVEVAEEVEPEEETETEKIDKLLDEGWSLDRLVKAGYARSTIRMRMRKRAKTNPPPPDNGNNGRPEVALTKKEKEEVLPEWVAGQIEQLYDGSVTERKAFQAGLSIPLLGLRMFAEMVKPLGILMQMWSAQQAEAAKVAQGGSEEVAQQTIVQAMPYFKDMITEVSRNQAVNPMQAMFARMLEQPMQSVMNNLFSGMFKQPGQQTQTQGQGQSSLPPGWEEKK